jgi:hypothetical protein
VGEDVNKRLLYLVAISRKLDDPLSAIVMSGSGAGKSGLTEAIEKLCPPEDVVLLTRLTPQSGSYRKVVSRGVAAGDPPKGAETAILHAGGVEGGPGGFRRRAVAEDLKGPGRGTAGAEPRRVGRPRSSQTRQSVAWTTSPVHRLPGMGNGRGGRGASTLSAYLPEVR